MAVPVRFFVHLLPPSAAPGWLGWPLAAPLPLRTAPTTPDPAPTTVLAPLRHGPGPMGSWYAWRLMSMNNRELARSVFRFSDAELCRESVQEVQAGAGRLLLVTFPDPVSGQFTWHAELDSIPVAAGRRYDQEQNSRYAAKRFLDLVAGAEVADAIRPLRNRRGPAPSREVS